MMDPNPSAHQNFEQWLEAYLVTHPYTGNQADYIFTEENMFAAWVGGAIFAANKFFNPTLPPTILPDIFRARDDDDTAHD